MRDCRTCPSKQPRAQSVNARDFVVARNPNGLLATIICAVDSVKREYKHAQDPGLLVMSVARCVVPDDYNRHPYMSWVWIAPGSAEQLVEL